jgi:hypothetical protein
MSRVKSTVGPSAEEVDAENTQENHETTITVSHHVGLLAQMGVA